MSMYNAIHGTNPLAVPLMEVLSLSPRAVGRFRDCYLTEHNNMVVIAVYTRNGGGNRDDYKEQTKLLQSHPNYLSDRDESHDETYASYFFSIPDDFKDEITSLVQESNGQIVMPEPAVRFEAFMEKLTAKDTDDPEVKRAMDVGRKIVSSIKGAASGSASVIEVGRDGDVSIEQIK